MTLERKAHYLLGLFFLSLAACVGAFILGAKADAVVAFLMLFWFGFIGLSLIVSAFMARK